MKIAKSIYREYSLKFSFQMNFYMFLKTIPQRITPLVIIFSSSLAAFIYCINWVERFRGTVDSKSNEDNTFFSHPQVTFGIAVAALIILVVAGLVAGLFPAWRALQIKAIDAIREE